MEEKTLQKENIMGTPACEKIGFCHSMAHGDIHVYPKLLRYRGQYVCGEIFAGCLYCAVTDFPGSDFGDFPQCGH